MPWREVTRSEPCPICGKPDWCSRSEDGRWAVCRRVDTGEGRHKVDKAGTDFWLYRLDGRPWSERDVPELPANPEPERAGPDALDQVYRRLLALLKLEDRHREALRRRGLTDAEIDARQYRTLPRTGRAALARRLVERFGPDLCAKVPGLFVRTGPDGRRWWTLAGTPGILIPARDAQGRIIALAIRADDPKAGKYQWLSSSRHKGPGPGAPAHVPLHEGHTETVRLVEGTLKSDVCAALGGMLAIGVAGVSAYRSALPILEALGTKRVVLAYDADAREKPTVAKALERAAAALASAGFEVEVEVWDPALAKGLDDLLLLGYQPERRRGAEAWRAVVDTAAAAGAEPDPLAAARAVLAGLEERVAADPGAPFTGETLGALAVIRDQAPAEWARLRQMLRKAGVPLGELLQAMKRTTGRPTLRAVRRGEEPRPEETDFNELREDAGRYVAAKLEGFTFRVEPVSNWRAEPIERLLLEDGTEVLRLRARLVGETEEHIWDLPAEALLGRKELIRALPSTEWLWTGSDNHVQMLRALWRRYPAPRRRATDCAGRHGGLIVLPSGAYGPNGPVDPAPMVFVDRDGLAIARAFGEIRWPDPADAAAAKAAVAKHLAQVNVARVMAPAAGFVGALPWCALLRERPDWGGFPHLLIWGSQGGGKTSLGHLLWRLCGISLRHAPLELPRTKFARVRAWASTNLIPAWCDEYRPGAWPAAVVGELHHELRVIYAGGTEERGRPDLSVRNYVLRAPVILSGESWPADPALRERILAVSPNPETIRDPKNPHTAAFLALHQAPLEAFALPYWTWALSQGDWLQEAERARQWARELLSSQGFALPPRVVNNLAICRFGLTMLRRYLGVDFEWVGATEAAVFVAMAEELFPDGRRRLALDELLLLAAARAHRDLKYGEHWVRAAGMVVLRLEPVVTELRRFARQSGHPTDVLSEESYRRQIAELAGRPDSYVLHTTYKAKFAGNRSLRGVALDPDRLEAALGIDAELWDEPSEEEGGGAGW